MVSRGSRVSKWIAPFLLVALAGCAVSPPEWGYFDTDRHPTGAYPAHTGYYAGAYVVYPVTLLVLATLSAFSRGGGSGGGGGGEGGANVFGILFGGLLGAPFHLFCLCFHGDEEPGDGADGGQVVPAEVEPHME